MTVHHRKLWWGSWVIFIVVGVPGALIILRPYWQDRRATVGARAMAADSRAVM